MASKKALELDARLQQIIDEQFGDYEQYLSSVQDVQQYRRKRKEYWEKINARLREEAAINVGTVDTAASE